MESEEKTVSSQLRKGDFLSRYLILVLVALAITMVLHTRALRALEPANLCGEAKSYWLTMNTKTRRKARCAPELTKNRPQLASHVP